MRLLCLSIAVPHFIPFDSLSAQELPPIGPGSRVRVTAPDCLLAKQAATLQSVLST
jgi:hypothetical protein